MHFDLKAVLYNDGDGFPFAALYSNYNAQLCKKLSAALSSALLTIFQPLSNPENLLYDIRTCNASQSSYCGIPSSTVQQSQKHYILNTSLKNKVNVSKTRPLIMLQN